MALRAAKIPVEAHLFEKNGHGFDTKRASTDALAARLRPDLFSAWKPMQLAG